MDLRYLSRSEFARDQTHQDVSEVMSFLETIYTSVAENLPDVRDETYDGEPDHETSVDDPYSLHIGLYQQDSEKVAKEKVPKAKKRRRGVQVCPGRTVAEGCEERWLPNGTMKEYWVQFCTQNPSAKVSFPTFWRVPRQNFIYRFVYQDVCSLDTRT